MSKTICLTVCRTLTLEDNVVEHDMTDEELIEEVTRDYDDWYWDEESVTVEIKPTNEVILGEED